MRSFLAFAAVGLAMLAGDSPLFAQRGRVRVGVYTPGFSFSYGSRPYYGGYYSRGFGYYGNRYYGPSIGVGIYTRPWSYSNYYYSSPSYYYSTPSYYYSAPPVYVAPPTYVQPSVVVPSSYYYSVPSVSYYSPCAYVADASTTTLGLGGPAPATTALAVARSSDGTYLYDGGPRQRIPMPDGNPLATPNRPHVPVDSMFVSLPRESTGDVSSVPTEYVSLRTAVRESETTAPANRYTYPAYGESR